MTSVEKDNVRVNLGVGEEGSEKVEASESPAGAPMPETSKPVDEREREAKKVGESAAAAPQGPVHSKSASGGSTEKALRFREEPEVREVPALPEEPSDIEEGKAGEGDLQERDLPESPAASPRTSTRPEAYTPPPVPLDEIELKKKRLLSSSFEHTRHSSSGSQAAATPPAHVVIAAAGPVTLHVTAEPATGADVEAAAAAGSGIKILGEGGQGIARGESKEEGRNEFGYAPDDKLIEVDPAAEVRQPPPDPRPLPGVIDNPAHHEQFKAPPYDRLERESRELYEKDKREAAERAAEAHRRSQEREDHLAQEKKRDSYLRLVEEAREAFTAISEAQWARQVVTPATAGVQAENARTLLSSIRSARGLLFLSHRKRGLVISADTGAGFVAVKHPDGRWAGPAFVTVKGLGLGATIGSATTRTLGFLYNPSDVQSLAEGKAEIQLTGHVTSTAGGGEPIGTGLSTGSTSTHESNVLYSITEGTLVDASLSGMRISFDDEGNKLVWGREDATAVQVLAGGEGFEPFPAVIELLKYIQVWIQTKERENVGGVDLTASHGDRVAPNPVPFYKVFGF